MGGAGIGIMRTLYEMSVNVIDLDSDEVEQATLKLQYERPELFMELQVCTATSLAAEKEY
jgi:hypothetical protein